MTVPSILTTPAITVTATWVDSWGTPAPNPPDYAYFLQSASVVAHARGATRQFDVHDGLGDDPVTSPWPVYPYDGEACSSSGLHLIMRSGSSGTITWQVPIICSADASASGDCQASFDWSLCVTPDTRGALISSSLGSTTYCSGTPLHQSLPQVVDPDGTVHAHSATMTYVTFSAIPVGPWHSNSSYHWYDSSTTQWGSGLFSQPTPLPRSAGGSRVTRWRSR